MISGQKRPEDLANVSRAVELVLSIHLNILSFTKVGDNDPWLSEWTHEHLDYGRVEVGGKLSNVAPDFFRFRTPFQKLCAW